MSTPQDFVRAISAAGDALVELAAEASAARAVATDVQEAGIAENAFHFATHAGPISLERARNEADPAELLQLQNATENITGLLDGVVVSGLGARLTFFLAFPMAGLLVLTPAEILDEVEEQLRNLPLPPPPQALPWWVWAGLGAAAGATLGAGSGGARGFIGGAIAGGATGALARLALRGRLG